MTVTTDAIIAFGIDLGEGEPAFLRDGDDFNDFIVAEAGLKKPETRNYNDPAWPAYWQARREAIAAYPLDLITHCHHEVSMYFLAIRGTEKRANRGDPVRLGSELNPTKNQMRTLREFCEKHGIEWNGEEPGWHLFSYWG